MILCIPILENLSEHYDALAKAIVKAGASPHHTLVTLAVQSNDDAAYQFSEAVADIYGKNVKITLEDQPRSPKDTANRFFNAACKAFQKIGNDKFPMLYMDPTYRPTTKFWLDNLQANYFRSGAPEVFANFQPEVSTPQGPIILSMKYVTTSTLRQFLPPGTHWRSYLAMEMRVKNSPEASESLTNQLTCTNRTP